jgi:hypothetical protein
MNGITIPLASDTRNLDVLPEFFKFHQLLCRIFFEQLSSQIHPVSTSLVLAVAISALDFHNSFSGIWVFPLPILHYSL